MNLGLKIGILPLLLFVTSLSFAQEEKKLIDPSQLPRQAAEITSFVPRGWKIEEQSIGKLNNDSLPDYVLKLVEDKPATKNNFPNERQRALIILLGAKEGKFSLAAVSDRLLQCTTCGGAFYGAIEAPAHIKIIRDVLVVHQDHGSRDLVTQTYRFRYEPAAGKFALIGFDFTSSDRATGKEASESTNYLTGMRVITRRDGKKDTASRQSMSGVKVYIEQVDAEKFDAAAVKRLHL